MPAENCTPQNAYLKILHAEREAAYGKTIGNARHKYTATVLSLSSASLASYLGRAKVPLPVLFQILEPYPESRAYNYSLKNLKEHTVFLFKVIHREDGISGVIVIFAVIPDRLKHLPMKWGRQIPMPSPAWGDANPTPPHLMSRWHNWTFEVVPLG